MAAGRLGDSTSANLDEARISSVAGSASSSLESCACSSASKPPLSGNPRIVSAASIDSSRTRSSKPSSSGAGFTTRMAASTRELLRKRRVVVLR